MNHESRIKQLEAEVINLKQILRGAGLLEKFVPLSLASNITGESPWVIRERIKSDERVVYDRHYRKNGNRYYINIEQWRKLKAADVKAKRT